MGRKHEFKPDRPYSNWVSKLMPTYKQQRNMLKWTLYLLVLLALSVLQDVLLSRVRVLGATTELIPCAVFLFCLIEGTENGSIFALLSSLLYLFSGNAPGIFSVILITAVAIFISILRQAFLRKSFSSAVLCTSLAVLVYELLTYVAGLALGLTYPQRIVGFLITAGLTIIAIPVLYPIGLAIGAIGGQTWKE